MLIFQLILTVSVSISGYPTKTTDLNTFKKEILELLSNLSTKHETDFRSSKKEIQQLKNFGLVKGWGNKKICVLHISFVHFLIQEFPTQSRN